MATSTISPGLHQLEPVVRDPKRTHADQVYERLLSGIAGGLLARGDVLSEVAIAKQLQVSRTPVHDAIRKLAEDGLVQRKNNRRARVTNFTRDDIFDIYEIRKYLEGPAARSAAGRMDQRDLLPLRSFAHQLQHARRDAQWVDRWIEYDELFHSEIARCCGNSRLQAAIARYRRLHRGINEMSVSLDNFEIAFGEHQKILQALEDRNGQAAHTAMVDHLTTWQNYYMQHFPVHPLPGGSGAQPDLR